MLDTLIWLKNETDVWVEITTLLIPDENDSEEEIKKECDWILENLGENVPLHFTAFHPDFKMRDKKNNQEFYVEVKWREGVYNFKNKIQWCNRNQLSRYKKIDENKAKVFICNDQYKCCNSYPA